MTHVQLSIQNSNGVEPMGTIIWPVSQPVAAPPALCFAEYTRDPQLLEGGTDPARTSWTVCHVALTAGEHASDVLGFHKFLQSRGKAAVVQCQKTPPARLVVLPAPPKGFECPPGTIPGVIYSEASIAPKDPEPKPAGELSLEQLRTQALATLRAKQLAKKEVAADKPNAQVCPSISKLYLPLLMCWAAAIGGRFP